MPAEAVIAIVAVVAGFVGWLTKIAYDTGYVRRRFEELTAAVDSLQPAVETNSRRLRSHERRIRRLETPTEDVA